MNVWSLYLRNCAGRDNIYFEFNKAFDSTSHPKLMTKLKAYGRPIILSVVVQDHCLLHGSLQSVLLNNHHCNKLDPCDQRSA
jgi:hypothetical protein